MGDYLLDEKFQGNYLGGEFVKDLSGNSFESISPADSSQSLGVYCENSDLVGVALENGTAAFKLWRRTSFEDRLAALRRVQESFRKYADPIAEALALEVGKPLWEAKTEVKGLIGKLDATLAEGMGLIEDRTIENILPNTTGQLRFRPLGVMAVLGPFNFPAHLPNGHITPALLTGNTVIFKPSEKTPLVGQWLARCFHEADLPKGVFQLLQGGRETSALLAAHSDVAGVLFTGSYGAGRAIKQATLDQPHKLLALEMGGKNSALVWEDANLDNALYEVLTGAYMTTGQRCSATSRVLVHRKLLDEFTVRLQKMVASIEVSHPMEGPFMGPLIDASSKDRFLKATEVASEEFDELVPGTELDLQWKGNYVSPALHFASKADLKVVQENEFLREEIFGPSLTIIPFDDLQIGIEMVNSTDYGLVASVFSASEEVFEDCWHSIDTGLLNYNKSTVGASGKLPFGGFKKSGNHWPTASFGTRYCTLPVSSMKVDSKAEVKPSIPGFTWV